MPGAGSPQQVSAGGWSRTEPRGQLGTDALALAAGGDGGGGLRQQWKGTGEASAARGEPYPGPPPAERASWDTVPPAPLVF